MGTGYENEATLALTGILFYHPVGPFASVPVLLKILVLIMYVGS